MGTLDLHNVTKIYDGTRVLDAVTCSIQPGNVYGLIGPNGAGKTTLLRAIAGQIPVRGEVTLDGQAVRDNQPVLDRLILAGADVPYPGEMTVGTLLDLAAARWASSWDPGYAAHLREVFDLNLKARYSTLSRGQKTTVGVVIGLSARTEITLLDEPYLGLDVDRRDRLYRELLEEISRDSAVPRTFILSTHQVDDASLLLGAVILIDEGQVTTVTGVEELTSATVVVAGTTGAVDAVVTRADRPVLSEDGTSGARRVVLDASTGLSEILRAADGLDVRVQNADLEETVLVRGKA